MKDIEMRPVGAIDLLNPFVLQKIRSMTYPAYRHLLDPSKFPNLGCTTKEGQVRTAAPGTNSNEANGGAVLAVAGFDHGLPVSLALGMRPQGETKEVTLLSLFTDRDYRGLGTGSRVACQFSAAALERWGPGIAVVAIFEEGREYSDQVNRILDRAGFGPGVPRCTIFRCDKSIAGMPWLEMYFELPAPFEMTDWSKVPAAAIESLARTHARDKVYPEPLSPFRDAAIIEPSNSLALMRDGGIAGWSMTHRPVPDTIRYSSIFVLEEYRGFGLAIPLLMESIRRHVLTPLALEAPNATFVVYHDNPDMMRMVRRRMARYAMSENQSVERRLVP